VVRQRADHQQGLPYSMIGDLGDKSDERSRYPRPHRIVNYVEDSVKATVDAASGKLTFYRMTDDPLIGTWSDIYPELFVDGRTQMTAEVRSQLTYPLQYFHLQFDDLYIYYHMKDPMYYFNMEDMFDDADEVLGPIMTSGDAIRFSTEPQSYLLATGGAIPRPRTRCSSRCPCRSPRRRPGACVRCLSRTRRR